MPQAVAGIGAALTGGAIAGGIGGTTGLIVGALVATGISFAAAKAFGPGAAKASIVDDLERGTFVNVAGTEEYIPVIYGRAKVGGLRFFGPELTGGNDEFLHMAVAWSEGDISGIEKLLIDDLVHDAHADEVYQVDDSGPTFVDIAAAFNSVADADLEPFPTAEAVGDYIAIGSELKFTKVVFDNKNGTAGAGGAVVWEYSDGAAWTALANVSDGTSGFTAAASDGQAVTFDLPDNWSTRSLNGGEQLFYIRARVTTVYSTNPVYDQGRVHPGNDIFGGLTLINHHVGTDDQAADPDMLGVAGWSGDHRARGVAYTYAKLTGDDTAFHAGMPELNAIIDGRLVLDPRDSTTKFSDNPALVIYDYATNTRYGRGIPASKLDDQSFIDAANFCDELVTVPDDSGGNTTQKRYTCAGVIDTGRDRVENMRDLLTSCRGQLVYTAGKWRLFVDKAESSVFSITEDHIIGEWSFSLPAQTDVLNRVKMNFLDPDREWQPDFGVWEDATLRSDEDDGLLLERNIGLPFTKNVHMAEQLALIEGKYSRFGIEVSMLCTIEAAQLLPMDVVTVTHTTPGWTSKKFRVVNLVMEQNGNVRLFLREYSDSIYTLDPLTDADLAPTTNLPDTRVVSGPINFSNTTEPVKTRTGDETFRLKLFWTLPNDQFVLNGGQTEVQFKETAESDWRPSWFVAGGISETYIAQAEQGVAYDARIRHINVFGARSLWATITNISLTLGSDPLPIDDGFFSGRDSFLDFGTFSAALTFDEADEVYQVDASGPTFVDITTDFNDAGDADFQPFPATEAIGDYIAIGSEHQFTKAVLDNLNGTAGAGGAVAWEYWDGGAWVALTGVTDGTSGFTAAVSDGQAVTFDLPVDWARQSLSGGASLYYIRARVTTVYTTNPVYDQGRVNSDYGFFQNAVVETLDYQSFGV